MCTYAYIYTYNTSGYTVYPHIIILRVVHPPPIPIIFVMEKLHDPAYGKNNGPPWTFPNKPIQNSIDE
jgi:hypothetical protein